MGESLQGSNRIYCVVRPEWSETERECNEALAYFSENFYPYLLKDFIIRNFDFSIFWLKKEGLGVNFLSQNLIHY